MSFLVENYQEKIEISPGLEANPREPNDIERLPVKPGEKLIVGAAFCKEVINGVEYAAPIKSTSSIDDIYGIVADDGEPLIDNPWGKLDLDGELIKIKVASKQIRAFTFNSKMSCGVLWYNADANKIESANIFVIVSNDEDNGFVGTFILSDKSSGVANCLATPLNSIQNKMRPFNNTFYFEHTNISFTAANGD